MEGCRQWSAVRPCINGTTVAAVVIILVFFRECSDVRGLRDQRYEDCCGADSDLIPAIDTGRPDRTYWTPEQDHKDANDRHTPCGTWQKSRG
jgi:hypothetical protein